MAAVRVMPAPDHETWTRYQLSILDEILRDSRITPKYKHGLMRRITSIICTPLVTLCFLPCCVYDTACCCVHATFCKTPNSSIKWGCFCDTMASTLDETFRDERKHALKTLNVRTRPDVLKEVCNTFLKEFDRCVAHKEAKKANMIRAELVKIIQKNHRFIIDDGNVDNIRKLVSSLPKTP